MANTYTKLLYHLVWSTKNRLALIPENAEEQIWAYLAGIAKANHIHPVRIGGVDDHIHALLELPKTLSVSEAMKRIKGGSSKWLNDGDIVQSHFQWQDGYGAFTVSLSKMDQVEDYILHQREHHRSMTFAEEYEVLLRRHGIAFDPKYHLD